MTQKIKEQLNKAFDSSGSTSPLVELTIEEASVFTDAFVDQSSILKKARVEKIDRATKSIGKLIGNGRFLHAGGHDVELDPDLKDSFTPSRIVIATKELIGAIDVYDHEIKHNIEGAGIQTHLLNIISKKIANELEEIAIYSDTAPATAWGATESAFGLFDGWRKKILAGGNVVNASSGFSDAKVSREKFIKLIKSLPTKFRKGVEMFCHDNIIIDYNSLFDANFNRNTLLDNILGVPLNGTPNMRFDSSQKTDVILTPPENLIMAVQIEDAAMSFEKERVAKLRKTTYHFQMEVDFAVEEPLAASILKLLLQLI